MTIISQKNRNKGKPYIFTHDPKLINKTVQYKRDFELQQDIFRTEKQ